MDILGKILAQVDNVKRTTARNISDALNDTANFAERLVDQVSMDMGHNIKSKEDMKFTPGKSASAAVVRDGELKVERVPGMMDDPSNFLGAGTIRPMGAKSLNMVHNLGSANELDLIKLLTGRRSLSSPSIAIAEDNVFPFSASPTVLFNPASHRFDPASSVHNQLFNRDAYVATGKTHVDAQHWATGKDARLTQDYEPGTDQRLSILASPRFNSFKEFEESVFGKGVLTKNPDFSASPGADELEKFLAKNVENYSEVSQTISPATQMLALKQFAAQGNKDAKELLTKFRSAPSDYAELKVAGEVPINPSTVSAVMIPEAMKDSYFAMPFLKEKLRARGIRYGAPSELLPEANQQHYRDMVSRIEADILQVSPTSKPLSEETRKYLSGSDAGYLIGSKYTMPKEEFSDAVAKAVMQSDQFAADVASIITESDAQNLINIKKGIK